MKKAISKIILKCLLRGIKVGYALDENIKKDIDMLSEKSIIIFSVLQEEKAFLKFVIDKGKIYSITKNTKIEDVQKENILNIQFKSLNDFYQVAFFKENVKQAFCSHKLVLAGDIFKAVPLTRVVSEVERYLLPKFIYKKILEVKTMKISKFKFYLKFLLNI